MADSLVLTGVKDVKKHTGTEMLLTRPKRGGDTHSIKEWWKVGPNKCYVMCTVFDVTTASGTVKLAVDSNAGLTYALTTMVLLTSPSMGLTRSAVLLSLMIHLS